MSQKIPIELAQPVRDEIETSPLSEELISVFNDPGTIKVLTTTDEEENPYSVIKSSFNRSSCVQKNSYVMSTS